MSRKKKAPELTFQQHIADFLVREHGYGVLEQADITDTEHFIAEDQRWAFLKATQADTLKKLTDDYGTDARDEVFKALRKELAHTPLWMLLRHGLKVRGLPRRRLSRTGERRDSDRLRRARTLRRTGGSQVHGHRRYLRHHGGHRNPAPSVIPGMSP